MAREESFFDALARGLADGSITRGKALRLMGAALVGGTLGSLGIGEAAGAPPGCKRIGKHCTRNPQCCGSLVRVSGSCQTPATTTTETPATTTTETPTTTCSGLPNGASCSTSGDCCSGNCKSGTCVESCIPPNAIRCDPNNPTAACTCMSQGSGCVLESGSGEFYCRSGAITATPCATSCDCPTGQFCEPSGDENFCAVAC